MADPVQVNIPSQALSSALSDLAKQTNLQIIYSQDTVSGLRSRDVVGEMEPEAALRQLLGAARIVYQIEGNHVTLQGSSDDAVMALPVTSIVGQAYSLSKPHRRLCGQARVCRHQDRHTAC